MMALDEKQIRLLRAAGEVFADKGFKAATVKHICDRAGIHQAAVNYHFDDKESLYLEAVRYAFETVAEKVPLPQWPDGTPPERKLRDFIHTFLTRLFLDNDNDWPCRLIMREMAEPTAACRVFAEGFARPSLRLLLSILDELLPPDTPPVKRHLTAFSVVGQILHYRLARPVAMLLVGPEEFHSYTVELLTNHITAFSLAALGRGGERS